MIDRKETNNRIKDELLDSMNLLLSGRTNTTLLNALKLRFPVLSAAFILNWIPEQAEDIYHLLIDTERVAVVEIPRSANIDAAQVKIDILNVDNYRKFYQPSVGIQRKLNCALDLLRIHQN